MQYFIEDFMKEFDSRQDLREHVNGDPQYWDNPLYRSKCIIEYLYKTGSMNMEKYNTCQKLIHDRIVLSIVKKQNIFTCYSYLVQGGTFSEGPLKYDVKEIIVELSRIFFRESSEDFLRNVVCREDIIQKMNAG